jgi:hypothetical protein
MPRAKKSKKKSSKVVDADYLSRHKESLRRKHRQVIYLNDRELAAIDAYCSRFQVSHRSILLRDAIMSRVLETLDENPPSLF